MLLAMQRVEDPSESHLVDMVTQKTLCGLSDLGLHAHGTRDFNCPACQEALDEHQAQ